MLIGDAGSWLAQFRDVEQRLIARLPTVWPVCVQGLPTQPLEDQITRRLAFQLQRDREARNLGAIHSQLLLLEEQLTGDVVPKGYIDLAVVLARLGQPDGISPSRMAEMLEVDKAGPKLRC